MKKLRKMLALLMVAAMMLTITQPITSYAVASTGVFVDGSGTEEDPYLISNKYQLDNVRNDLAAHYKLTCDIEFDESDFAEGGDFYNDGAGFVPIGSYWADAFDGIFDGNGYTIKNLYINFELDSSNIVSVYVGLFGYNGGTIYGMVDGNISATTSGWWGASVGGIAGENDYGTITNCYNTSYVTATSGENSARAGGIVGVNLEGTITNCYNIGYVTATSSCSEATAGGIAGVGYYDTIMSCYNTGDVSATTTASGSYSNPYAGRIVGYSRGTILYCYNTGDIIATASCDNAYAGGITGYNDYGTITNCYNTGGVYATSTDESAYAGGIAGRNYYGTITNCYNIGDINGTSGRATNAGGIVGDNDNGTITNCYNISGVAAVTLSSRYVASAGGIAGFNNHRGKIINCYNTGDVSAISSVYYYASAGGTVGYNRGTITNCCYLDIISVSVGNDYGTSVNVVKCTSDELKDQTTFVGFDFENVWTFDDTLVLHEYPVLKDVAHYENIVYGDLDGDEELTAMDALMMKQYFVEMIDDSDIIFVIADINGDGALNSKDLLLLKQKLAE